MPVYKNNTAATITPPGAKTFAAGASYELSEYLQDQCGLDLISHIANETTGKLLYAAVPGGAAVEVYPYDVITVFNDSGATAKLIPNNDTSNYWIIGTNSGLTIENKSPRTWHTITTDDGGGGNLYIWGL